jgi:hypothetical protein
LATKLPVDGDDTVGNQVVTTSTRMGHNLSGDLTPAPAPTRAAAPRPGARHTLGR